MNHLFLGANAQSQLLQHLVADSMDQHHYTQLLTKNKILNQSLIQNKLRIATLTVVLAMKQITKLLKMAQEQEHLPLVDQSLLVKSLHTLPMERLEKPLQEKLIKTQHALSQTSIMKLPQVNVLRVFLPALKPVVVVLESVSTLER